MRVSCQTAVLQSQWRGMEKLYREGARDYVSNTAVICPLRNATIRPAVNQVQLFATLVDANGEVQQRRRSPFKRQKE